ncbi:MAG: hypothetical protein EPN37_19245 [Chitinophagaceae bacterium]|nr:MAG: hypothetical protein EPN37_19245 [Chitinophagaceae bacterium]
MDQESVSAAAMLWRALLTTAKLAGLMYVVMWAVWALVAALVAVTVIVTMPAVLMIRGLRWWRNRG